MVLLTRWLRGIAALLAAFALLLMPLHASAAPETGKRPRVTGFYTTWDDYYFYAAFQVSDPNVVGTNKTPISQPQMDDDIEVFFETDNAKAGVRTPQTYQMAISAASGSYFSVGNGQRIPVAKAVYTYKYATTTDGTLNNAQDTDTGFTVSLAIPWQEMGQAGPPKDGTVWGFNAISRDRTTLALPASRFYSLSPNVQSAADVQTPSKWTEILFDASNSGATVTSAARVVSPRVLNRFPTINGTVRSGEWPAASRLAFGATGIDAPAPTAEEEPNTATSPFTTRPNAPITLNPPVVATNTKTPTGVIRLPGGGFVKVVPGGIKVPSGLEPDAPTTTATVNPLTPKGFAPVTTPAVSLTGSLTLTAPRATPLVMAIYRTDFNADKRKAPAQNVWDAKGMTILADQPVEGCGPWFSGLHTRWHREQLTDLRRSGINVALLRVQASDPLLPRELDSLVAALKEMKARGIDYPLIGVDVSGPDPADPYQTLAHIPAEFQATLIGTGAVVYVGSSGYPVRVMPGVSISALGPEAGVAVVSPGQIFTDSLIGRKGGQTYDASWKAATDAKANFVLIDSWNDFTRATEVCASRQYGEQYADKTRLRTLAYNGVKQWHAKYLAEYVPRVIQLKTLYQVPIRIENAGTLPWRAGEDYALVPRWYKDGRLYDDSAPRIPVGTNVLPGKSLTLSVGLVARNNFGEDLEPGQYTLVFDMVQGQDRWFSYADDAPLQVPVTITTIPVPGQAIFVGSQTPAFIGTGQTAPAPVQVRNEGSTYWTAGTLLVSKIQRLSPTTGKWEMVSESAGSPFNEGVIRPGQITTVAASISAEDGKNQPLTPGAYRVHWYIRTPDGKPAVSGSYDEPLTVAAEVPSAAFSLSDIPRTMESGHTVTVQAAVQNISASPLLKGQTRLGYHWLYLDGSELSWDDGLLTPLPRAIAPGKVDALVDAKVRAPQMPGRYALAWDIQSPDGRWASTLPASQGNDLLPVLVTVTGKNGAVPVSLTKYAELDGIAGEANPTDGDFDGQGHTFPAESLPPDNTTEVEGNPILFGKPGLPLYPTGDYLRYGAAPTSAARVPFLYPSGQDGVKNVVVCHGQTIDLPDGSYKAIHLLAAATGGSPVQVTFAGQPVTIADWTHAPTNAELGFRCLYQLGKNGPEPGAVYLGDYAIPLAADRRLTELTLPSAPGIKIVAITLER